MVMIILIIICVIAIIAAITATVKDDISEDDQTTLWVIALIAIFVTIGYSMGIGSRCPDCKKNYASFSNDYCTSCGHAFIIECSNGHRNSEINSYCRDCGESLAR